MRDLPRRASTFFLSTADSGGEVVWRPRADIYQTPNGWLVKVELAGVRTDEITLWACGSRLTISGIRRDRVTAEGWRCHAMEISYSRFERCITLPCDLGAARIAVKCHDGMLLVHVAAEGTQR
jgi:HSP20 family protein